MLDMDAAQDVRRFGRSKLASCGFLIIRLRENGWSYESIQRRLASGADGQKIFVHRANIHRFVEKYGDRIHTIINQQLPQSANAPEAFATSSGWPASRPHQEQAALSRDSDGLHRENPIKPTTETLDFLTEQDAEEFRQQLKNETKKNKHE
ncbi:MAG TPA: hypothetical protein VN673_17565 [Clostridia bacterium]|nr:hypothetical protein [Clostridia bacterium]